MTFQFYYIVLVILIRSLLVTILLLHVLGGGCLMFIYLISASYLLFIVLFYFSFNLNVSILRVGFWSCERQHIDLNNKYCKSICVYLCIEQEVGF